VRPPEPGPRIVKVLVANRGEIALRIFRTCRRLGLATVAVAAADDAGALHTREAGEVVAVSSYLEPAEIVRAARASGADAVHPGYGFLAESPELAAAVIAAGVTWIGPPVEALRRGGDKLEAKQLAVEAGVPTLPSGTAEEVGLPLLVKAAAGGGGRGMRVVRTQDELAESLVAARREAAAAFGDDRVYCERLLERPRHVEIQLLADVHGTVVSLGERDCSVQRRHQKVVEESPSPAVDQRLRRLLEDAATAFARAIGYVGAGTAEFLVDGEAFWFLELNARIQVEHPVTELVTGLDLIEEQIRIARREPARPPPLPSGHAVEARLYAEDPRTFLPQTGRISALRLPGGVRVDRGVAAGDEIGTRYDPLLAKLVAAGGDRREALDRLAAALASTEVRGVRTNLPFLRWLVAHPAFRAGEATTAVLLEHPPLSAPPPPPLSGPWTGGFRLNLPPVPRGAAPREQSGRIDGGSGGGALDAPMPGTVVRVDVVPGDRVEPRQPLLVLEAMKMEMPVVAPYAGVIRAIHVAEGDAVSAGQALVELGEGDPAPPD
jgi:acetyl/propionyl-CoA carboxylase alpha subunit